MCNGQSILLVVFMLIASIQADIDIQTTPNNQTAATYIGTTSSTSFGSQEFYVAKFLGVRYADPPARFQIPTVKTPEEEVIIAQTFGNICQQAVNEADTCIVKQQMSEDCLFLNIFVPLPNYTQAQHTRDNESSSQNTSLPSSSYAVLLFLHGGGYGQGSGNCVDGSRLAAFGGIIVVTFNVRLGTLALLTTNDDLIPGNLALWDQHIAIQWVSRNIQTFGGDPDRITVGGASSGSLSSLFQAFYQENDMLFKRIIAQSFTPLAAKSTSVNGYDSTLAVAESLGCSTASKQAVKDCLMNQTATALANTPVPILVPGRLPLEPTLDSPLVTFQPSVLSPMTLLSPAPRPPVPEQFVQKDLLIGTVPQDGDVYFLLLAATLASNNLTRLTEILTSHVQRETLRQFIVYYFQQNFTEVIDELLVDLVEDRYIYWESNSPFSLGYSTVDLLTDVFATLPSLDTASAHILYRDVLDYSDSGHGKGAKTAYGGVDIGLTPGRTFVYRFSLFPPSPTAFPLVLGTRHGSEYPFVFGESYVVGDKRGLHLSRTVMTYWSNFVKTGDPNRDDEPPTIDALPPNTDDASNLVNDTFEHPFDQPQKPPLLLEWLEYNSTEQMYLELSHYSVSRSRLRASFRHFWSVLVPKLRSRLLSQ